MTVAEHWIVVTAGLIAGMLSSTVGVASLLSFPVLIAVGIPPVVANVSNTLGLIPAALSGSVGYRRELREAPRVTRAVMVVSALGAVAGAALLLALAPGVFEAAVPWLILFTCLTVGVQPWISRWLKRRSTTVQARAGLSPATMLFAGLTGVYAGYFGAGAGVMMIAVLGFGTELDLRIVTAIKTIALLAANVVAGVVFVFVADIDFTVAGLLAAGSIVGGYAGAHLGRRLPPTLLRVLIVIAGVVAAILML